MIKQTVKHIPQAALAGATIYACNESYTPVATWVSKSWVGADKAIPVTASLYLVAGLGVLATRKADSVGMAFAGYGIYRLLHKYWPKK